MNRFLEKIQITKKGHVKMQAVVFIDNSETFMGLRKCCAQHNKSYIIDYSKFARSLSSDIPKEIAGMYFYAEEHMTYNRPEQSEFFNRLQSFGFQTYVSSIGTVKDICPKCNGLVKIRRVAKDGEIPELITIHALDILYTNSQITTFIFMICSSRYLPLIKKLRDVGKKVAVISFGVSDAIATACSNIYDIRDMELLVEKRVKQYAPYKGEDDG